MKYLVTDDSMIARKMIVKTLKQCSTNEATIHQATNGLECYGTYKKEKPNLVFLDLTMPIMDGFETIEKIIAFDKNAKIIVVSADIQKGSMEKVSQLGALGFIKKPINEDSMNQVLKKIQNEL